MLKQNIKLKNNSLFSQLNNTYDRNHVQKRGGAQYQKQSIDPFFENIISQKKDKKKTRNKKKMYKKVIETSTDSRTFG